jgi:glycosyltransferase involved in cell wall biosynthesis
MKIAVVSDEHFPHTGADTEVIVNTAAALGAAGAAVTLVVPFLWKRDRFEEILSFYGVNPTFRLETVLAWPAPSRALRLEKIFHGVFADTSAAVRSADVVHSRDALPLVLGGMGGLPWSFETYRRHAEEKPWLPSLLRHLRLDRGIGAVAHTDASRADLVRLGFPDDAVVVARPGFSLSRFEPEMSRDEARARLGLPASGPYVGYVGNIHTSKGMDQLIELASLLPEATFLVVGGSPSEVAELAAERDRKKVPNVMLIGHKKPADVAPYLFASDILFAPYLEGNVRSGFLAERIRGRVLPGTPLKLYAYLASRRPIVAADQPTNGELLRHEHNALLFPPKGLAIAAAAVRRLVREPELAARLADHGKEFARGLTWDARARTMLEFFERRLARRR